MIERVDSEREKEKWGERRLHFHPPLEVMGSSRTVAGGGGIQDA